jgi:TPR repeat protein
LRNFQCRAPCIVGGGAGGEALDWLQAREEEEEAMQVAARNVAPGKHPLPGARGEAQDIPPGFARLAATKSLPAMGRWLPLPDGLPPWLPFQALAVMAKREQAGDDTARHWLEVYRHAVEGAPAAQRRMGGACESGSAGIGPDFARAFFWYHRAGLSGDAAALERARRIRERHEIPEAAVQEPALVYPGAWHMRREDDDGSTRQLLLELHEDHRLSGPGMNGLWSFDAAHQTLTLAHRQAWRIALVARREAVLFGRDAGGVPCTLERMGPLGARETL